MRIRTTVYSNTKEATLEFSSPTIRTLNSVEAGASEIAVTMAIVIAGEPLLDGHPVDSDTLWGLDLISISKIQEALLPFFQPVSTKQ